MQEKLADPPPLLRALLNVVARQLGAGAGACSLELRFTDGEYREGYLRQKLTASDLDRLEHEPAGR